MRILFFFKSRKMNYASVQSSIYGKHKPTIPVTKSKGAKTADSLNIKPT